MSFDFLKENYTGLYIHYPFCLRKCPYCDFNSYARGRNENQDELYFLRLKEDFSSWMPKVKDRKFISVFIGGGTPSLCAPGLIGDFIDFIRLSADRYIFVMGDVSGKGLNASMSMVILKSVIRTYLQETGDFKELVEDTMKEVKYKSDLDGDQDEE